ncbi:hypothetical protein O4H26_04035 [Aequorivita viscosa]|nr:hypothetical protein [Aequorivita viscosa]
MYLIAFQLVTIISKIIQIDGTHLANMHPKQLKPMNTNSTNLCRECAHATYCVLTHNKSEVFSCSEFDELELQMPKPLLKLKHRKQELATI